MFLKNITMERTNFKLYGRVIVRALVEKYAFCPICLLNLSVLDQTSSTKVWVLLKICIKVDVSEKQYNGEHQF